MGVGESKARDFGFPIVHVYMCIASVHGIAIGLMS
jgi:hypothetical protein